MTTTQIRGNTQIKAGTIYNAQIADAAAIALSKLAEAVIQADGGQNFTANQSMAGFKLTTVGTPTVDGDAANKAYVDSMVTAGVTWKAPVRVATNAVLPANTWLANVITADDVGILTIDGKDTVLGDRILVKNGAGVTNDAKYNGIYSVTVEGTAGVAFELTRTADADVSSEMDAGTAMFVSDGTVNGDMGFVLTTNDPITLNTTALVFTQFTALGQITAGAGLTKTGSTLDVGAGNGITVSADSISIDLDGTSLSLSGAGIKVDYTNFVTRETPAGAVPGTVYTLTNVPFVGSEQLFLNGILQEEGAGNDYTIASDVITMEAATVVGDRVKVTYIKNV